MKDLLPCPFCGGEAIYVTHTHYYEAEDTVAVFCNSCKSIVVLEQNEAEGINEQTTAEAIKVWNTRAFATVLCFDCSYFENKPTCGAYCGYFDRELGDDYDGGCMWGVLSGAKVVE